MTPLKRRRLDATSSTLSKPFKSPLRRPPATPEAAAPYAPTKQEEHRSSTTTTCAQSTPDTIPTSHTTLPAAASTLASTPASTSKRKRTTFLPADPTLLHLEKQQRLLQAHLSSLRSDLDTAQQALRLESSTQDAELEALVAKWRGVAQSAADEVFEGARERVARMGGMKAWRERMREGRMGGWGEEEEQERGAEGEYDDNGEMLERHRGRGTETETETKDGDDGEDEEVSSGLVPRRRW